MAYKDIEKNRKYNREYQKNNLRELTEKKKKRQQRVVWVHEQKKGTGCKHYDESHPAALDYHHRNPEDKVAEISTAARKNWSMDRLLNEIAKCDLICSNCHRKLHWNERQS